MSSIQSGLETGRTNERGESAVIEFVDELDPIPDSEDPRVDATTSTLLEPSERVPSVGLPLVSRGTLVEIKTALVVYGADSRRGRFHFRESQHGYLLEEGAVYLLSIVDPTPARDVVAPKIVPATIVDEVLEGSSATWIETDGRPPYRKLSWSRFFDEDEVSKGGIR